MEKGSRPPSCPLLANVPVCTQSQLLHYIELRTGIKVAEVHQYVLPDGTIGASGMPDPKLLVYDGTLYAVRRLT